MKRRILFAIATAALLSITACGEDTPNKPNPPAPAPEYVPVFVLTGQSNMEGSTYWRYNGNNLLKDYMDGVGEDYSIIENGIENVLTSYYGYYYPLNSNTWATAHCAAQKIQKMQVNQI